jgi:hypothetical protein
MQNKPLTDTTYLDRAQRDQALAEVAAQSAKTADWLRQLIERQDRLTEEGNAYGEKYSERQYALAVAPIVQRELIRARILQIAKERGLTLTEIAEKLESPPIELMPHVVALRRRGQLLLEKVEDETTPVYRTVEQVEES